MIDSKARVHSRDSDGVLIETLGQSLLRSLDGLHWNRKSDSSASGQFSDGRYRLRIARRGSFVHVLCGGLEETDSRALCDMNSRAMGPVRTAKRRSRGPAHLAASWPVELPTSEQADMVADDMRRAIYGTGGIIIFVVHTIF